MLLSLEIRDLLLIDHLSLDLGPGLTVLTGETGAGKSILLDALGLALGWKNRAELVRHGADSGEVIAIFGLSAAHPARAILDEAGITSGDELILRRIVRSDGRRQAYANDRRVSTEILRRLSETLVELHGQHDDQGLLNPRGHRALLDAFGTVDTGPARSLWVRWRKANESVARATADIAEAAREEEFLRHAVRELDALDPQPGEEEALDTRRRLMQAASRIRKEVEQAETALGPDGAEGRMIDAQRWLEDAPAEMSSQLHDILAALERALNELAEAQAGLETCLRALEFDPHELETTEERLFAIRALARKHAVIPEELPLLAETMRQRLEALDEGETGLARLHQQAVEAESAYQAAADTLTGQRRTAAGRLDTAMEAELAPLKMERARFVTDIDKADPGPDGADQVTFTVATNVGAPPGPLDRIASGGELSRFLLALKVCLTRDAGDLTLIFDEIDRGVGGATADAVGRRLKSLAERMQVLVVTHSPQVAALGAHHWRVEKRIENGMTLSRITPLSPEGRVEEIARMLSGDIITAEARAAAEALLSS